MKAIPTTYAGVTFRSRLEAEWAHNLTWWRIAWSYEPGGVELPSGARYLPDFHLPDIDTWLEVKGPNVGGEDKIAELAAAERDEHPGRRYVVGRAPIGAHACLDIACAHCGTWVRAVEHNGDATVAVACHDAAGRPDTTPLFATQCHACGIDTRCRCGEKLRWPHASTPPFARLKWTRR